MFLTFAKYVTKCRVDSELLSKCILYTGDPLKTTIVMFWQFFSRLYASEEGKDTFLFTKFCNIQNNFNFVTKNSPNNNYNINIVQ